MRRLYMAKVEIEGRGAGLRRWQPWFWLDSDYDYGYGSTSIITFVAVDEQPDCCYY